MWSNSFWLAHTTGIRKKDWKDPRVLTDNYRSERRLLSSSALLLYVFCCFISVHHFTIKFYWWQTFYSILIFWFRNLWKVVKGILSHKFTTSVLFYCCIPFITAWASGLLVLIKVVRIDCSRDNRKFMRKWPQFVRN